MPYSVEYKNELADSTSCILKSEILESIFVEFNVRIINHSNFMGHFIVCNGTGIIYRNLCHYELMNFLLWDQIS